MAENSSPQQPQQQPGTVTVTDRRPQPRGVLPKHVQAWLMIGLAGAIVLIILFTGKPVPDSRRDRTPATTAQAPNPARLREVEERLRQLQREADDEAEPGSETFDQPAAAPEEPEDPLEAAMRRRRYEGLFASGLVYTRQNGAASHKPGSPERERDDDAKMPSLDEVAQAVVRASVHHPAATAPTVASSPTAPGDAAAFATAASPTSQPARALDLPIPDSTDAVGPLHQITRGTIIDAVLLTQVDGTVESPVRSLVTAPVYSRDGQHVLIPAGAVLLGKTARATGADLRLPVEFDRLIMPGGTKQYSLKPLPALDQLGQYGLRDRVRQNRWLSTFGVATAVGLVSGASQAVGRLGLGSGDRGSTIVIAGGGADAAAQAASQVMSRQVNRPPTVTVRSPARLKVYLTADLHLPAYSTP